jgi:hypothetical protein
MKVKESKKKRQMNRDREISDEYKKLRKMARKWSNGIKIKKERKEVKESKKTQRKNDERKMEKTEEAKER